MKPRPLLRGLAPAVVLVLVLGTSGPALADDERGDLNGSAVEAMVEGDHDRAIKLLRASLILGELNVTWLNLGRAYALSGRCKDALEAYDQVAVAPQVDEPPPEAIYEILTRYRDELIAGCPGQLQVRCSGEAVTVRIDDDPATDVGCDGQAISLPPGKHVVALVVDGQDVDRAEVDIEGMATRYVELGDDGSAVAPVDPMPPASLQPNPLSGPLMIGGSVTAGAGAALLIGGIVTAVLLSSGEDDLVVAVEEQRFDEAVEIADANDTLALSTNVLVGVGGLALTAGIAMIVTSVVLPDEAPQVSVSFGGDTTGLFLHHRF